MADSGDSFLLNRAEAAEAKLGTLKANIDALKDRVQQFKANFGVREKSDGSIDIDFEKMVDRLGPEASLELKSVIDDKYAIRSSRPRRHLDPQIHMNASQ
ncbi:hypothetical protein LCGC14_2984880 [marine sediment metagenome]|uniref:Uncharacterized protein n=1 Tax=marine sediment metagenome TaxID=412755 RepID=A0A0F8X5K1_9ZZZZ